MEIWKEATTLIKEEASDFINLIKTHSIPMLGVMFITTLAFGFEITNFTLSIDEERAIYDAGWNVPTVWITQGRPGIALIKLIFNTDVIVPFWNTLLSVSVLLFASLIWSQAFYKSLQDKKFKAGALFVFSVLFLTSPVHTEYMAFSTYNFEISVGYVLTAIAVLFLSHWFSNKRKSALLLGIIAYVAALTIYQSFITVFLCGVSILLVLQFNNNLKQGKSARVRESLSLLIQFMIILVMGVGLYKLIDMLLQEFYPSSGYVEGFFWWTYLDKEIIVNELRRFITSMISGNKLFGVNLLLPTILAGGLVGLYYLFKGKGYKVLLPVLMIIIIISPFLLSMLLGSPTPLRAMQALPIMFAGVWLIVYQLIDRETVKTLLIVVAFVVSIYQAQTMTRLFYSDNLRYQGDIVLAQRVAERIAHLTAVENPSIPVVFVGTYTHKDNPNIIRSEILGSSFFEWEGGNTHRIIAFMNTLGYNYRVPTKQDIEKARELSTDMTQWPDPGSIDSRENLIIVKLSN